MLTKDVVRLTLQIQREFRAHNKRRRAVRIVAATWPAPTADDFRIVASRVASISGARMKRQYRLMRRALAQLCQYISARAARRRQLHIKRQVMPAHITQQHIPASVILHEFTPRSLSWRAAGYGLDAACTSILAEVLLMAPRSSQSQGASKCCVDGGSGDAARLCG